jgi:hypothetical protein
VISRRAMSHGNAMARWPEKCARRGEARILKCIYRLI